MWSKIKARIKRNELAPAIENVVCKNCGTEFKGYFCPHCGQAVKEADRPFGFFFYNFVGDFFSFDERFFRTTIDLIFKPGFLTNEYFAGRRVRYAPPFRIFIFTSFLMFLLLQMYTQRGLQAVLKKELSGPNVTVDSTSLARLDSMLVGGQLTTGDSLNTLNMKIDFEEFRSGNLMHKLNVAALVLEEKQKNETDPETLRKNNELIHLLRTPEQVTAKILKYMSYAFFLLLPLFALILKVFYIRRKQNYVRHLVFSLHCHSYTFIIVLLITSLYLVLPFKLGLITLILMLTLPVYYVLAMKKFYGQRFGKVILKYAGIALIYSVLFWTAVAIVITKSLNLGALA